MALGNSTGECLAQEIDDRLKAPGNDGTPSPWGDVQLAYGRRELERNSTWYRVVWVPIGGPVEPPDAGRRARPTDDKASKPLRKAGLQHDVFIQGELFEDTEALWKAMLVAIIECTMGSLALEDFEWVTETQSHDFSVNGTMIRQRLAIDIPILNTDRTTVEVLYQSHTGRFGGPGGEIVCQS